MSFCLRLFFRLFSIQLVVLLHLFALFSGISRAGEITVLTPPGETVLHAKQAAVHLVLELSDKKDIKRLRVSKKGRTFKPVGTRQHKNAYIVHFHLPLKSGRNFFTVDPGNRSIKVTYRPLRTLLGVNFNAPSVYLFHRQEAVPAKCKGCHDEKLSRNIQQERAPYGPFSPACYSCHKEILKDSVWHHSPAANILCRSCHQADPAVDKISIQSGKVDKLCFRCHVNQRNWPGMKHVHGPVGTGDCTVCHNPHGDQFPSLLWADGKVELCLACHADKRALLKGNKAFYVHGILTGAGCIACHDAHATNNRFQLHKPTNELCVGCHTGIKKNGRGHPVKGHPVKGIKDPRRPDREFNCTSCHNPHGSDYKYLLIGDILGGHVCGKCHKTKGAK